MAATASSPVAVSTNESDIATLKTFTNVDEIRNQLRLLNAEESRVDAELDAALRSQGDLERSLEMLDVLRWGRDDLCGLLEDRRRSTDFSLCVTGHN